MTQTSPPVVVFAGAVYPGQFGALCNYLRAAGMAETYFLTTPGHRARNQEQGAHILAFAPDGPITGKTHYHYTAKLERSARIGRGLLKSLQELQKLRKIDVVVSHSLWGAPQFLYGEVDAAIVSYIEFPSYRLHGNDPEFPPDQAQRMTDNNVEMLNFYQALRSDLVICPSQQAKAMFPPPLQGNIEVQLEGIDFGPALEKQADAPLTIGFTARVLSNAKGFDTFVKIVDRLVQRGITARFVALGERTGPTYGYEPQWLQRRYNGEVPDYAEHVLRQYPAAAAVIDLPGRLPYPDYVQRLSDIDIFLYPLRFGVANWGLIEILGRGGCVIAPNHGYPTEVIHHGVNGLLVEDAIDAWANAVNQLIANPEVRQKLSRGARILGQGMTLQSVAPRYMALFRKAMDNRARRLAGGA